MLRRAFSLNLKKQPEVDLRSKTKSVILSLSLAGQVLYSASSSLVWNLFEPKSWISKYELAFTSSAKLILGNTASMCFQASENIPQPPLAFSETLLNMQADSASYKGRSQCWPIVSVLLMWEYRTALPTLRWVQEQSILRISGKSILILSSIMTFSTSFMSSNSFLFSLASLQTISISCQRGSLSAFYLAMRTILVQAFLSSTLCSLFSCWQASSTTLVRTGSGIMLALFFTSFSTDFKSSPDSAKLDYALTRAVSKLCCCFCFSSQILCGGMISRQVLSISALSEKGRASWWVSLGMLMILVIFFIIIIM